jgi:hypothetical protein
MLLKDPFHTEETPYELLGVDPAVRPTELQAALTRFLQDRRNLPKLGRAQEAVKSLKNIEARLSLDILFYRLERAPDNHFEPEDLRAKLEAFVHAPDAPDETLYSDLEKKDFSNDFSEIKFNAIQFRELNKYDGLDAIKLTVPFDK